MQREQAKATVERHGREITLLKDIGEGPVAVALHQTLRLEHGLHDETGGVGFIVQRIAVVRGAGPLRVVQRSLARLAPRRARLLLQYAAAARGQLRLGVIARLAEAIGRIVMGSDEVRRQMIGVTEAQELADPLVGGGSRTADPQRSDPRP